MSITFSMTAVIKGIIGLPVVVNRRTLKLFKYAYIICCAGSSLLMYLIMSKSFGPGTVKPLCLTAAAHAGFIEMYYSRGLELFLY